MIKLPQPQTDGEMSVEYAISKRRSRRTFCSKPISLAETGQLLWAGQGITGKRGHRAAPSAGALYPLELYVVAELVDSLDNGIYHYLPDGHSLKQICAGDFHQELAEAALQQTSVAKCSAIFVLSGIKERTSKKYGRRAVQYIMIEAGHTGQNISLQAETLNLGTVVIGAFDDEKIKELLKMPPEEQPISLMPVGHLQ